MVIGHEAAGVVEAVGEGVNNVKVRCGRGDHWHASVDGVA